MAITFYMWVMLFNDSLRSFHEILHKNYLRSSQGWKLKIVTQSHSHKQYIDMCMATHRYSSRLSYSTLTLCSQACVLIITGEKGWVLDCEWKWVDSQGDKSDGWVQADVLKGWGGEPKKTEDMGWRGGEQKILRTQEKTGMYEVETQLLQDCSSLLISQQTSLDIGALFRFLAGLNVHCLKKNVSGKEQAYAHPWRPKETCQSEENILRLTHVETAAAEAPTEPAS